MTTWSAMKVRVAEQMKSDPQRGTLSTRAWQAVEEGLQHLAGAGYNFEIAPKGTLGELNELKEPKSPTNPLSIPDGIAAVTAATVPDLNKFEAKSKRVN